jgi:subtilisin family serine protease
VGLLTLGVVVGVLSLQSSSALFASFFSRNPSKVASSDKKGLTETPPSTSPSVVVRAAKQNGSNSTAANRPTKTVPDSASPMDRPSAEELKRFPGSKVKQSVEVAGPGPNQTTRVRLLETDFKYPYVRTEEVVDTATGKVLLHEEMVATHVLVTLADGEDPTAFLAKMGAQATTMELVTPDAPLYLLHLSSPSLEALPNALDDAAAQASAVAVEPDYVRQAILVPNDPKYLDGTLWGLNQTSDADIDAPEGWNVRSSAGAVIVAVIDTGIKTTHQDLAANMWRNSAEIAGNKIDDDANGFVDDIFGCDAYNNDGDPTDDNGHGSHCAGTIGGVGNNGIGVTGVAWGVQMMACKFLSATGSGADSDAVRCIDYARSKGAKVLSNSWGGGGAGVSLQAAIERTRTAGLIFVAAAGNEGRNTDSSPSYPASLATDNIVSVAATTRTDTLASFSNYGSVTTDLGAPGDGIYSTVSTSDTAYATYSGTSMATPHVAGVLALLVAQFPAESYSAIITRLLNGTDKIPALAGKTKSGGRLNLANALLGAATPTPVRPANDVFASAIAASTATWTLMGNNTDGTSETGEPAHAGNSAAKSVWWAFTAPSSGTCTLRTFGSTFDTVLAVYTGTSVGSLLAVASNDNSTSTVLDSTVSFSTVKGTIYRFVVDGKSGASGVIQLSASLVAALTPVNDTFSAATVLTGTSFSVKGSNIGATVQTGEPKHAGIAGGKSVWWSWTAPSTGTFTLATAGSSFDTTLGIYTGTAVNALRVVGSNDDQSTTLRTSKVVVSVVAGTTYRIAVDGYSAASGAITLAGSLVAKAVLATPAGMAALRDTTGRITISWGAVASASSYEVTLTSGNTVYASGQVTGTRASTAGTFSKSLPLVAKVRALSGTGESGPWCGESAVR